VPEIRSMLFRLLFRSALISSILLRFVLPTPSVVAQETPEIVAEGYISALHPPNGFDVNGEHVITDLATIYGLIGEKEARIDDQTGKAVQVGAYVRILGSRDKSTKTASAASVLFRDVWDKKLRGFGLIEKVITQGPEPVFQADGYRIRVTPNTVTSLPKGMKALADVVPNMWLHYEGVRDESGVLIATHANFVSARTFKLKTVRGDKEKDAESQAIPGLTGQGSASQKEQILDVDGNLLDGNARVRLSDAGICGWHRVPADQQMQARVRRVGMSVVPSFQKQLADDDTAKIHFRFYAVEETEIRSALSCGEGLILVPRQVVERLKNDDQLAAVLADGVALDLQFLSAKLVMEIREFESAKIATEILNDFVPKVYFASLIGGKVVGNRIEVQMQEQRGRIALSLLNSAGYDLRQAPEAWRLLEPKRLPKDSNSLKFPNRSWYQFGILNVQYATSGVASTPTATVQANTPESR
jgi:hypothetical protein